jgi:DNA polymerase-3 subunit epsilon
MKIERFTAFDLETANHQNNSICQIGIIVYDGGEELYHFQSLIQPPDNLYHYQNIKVHGIKPSDTLNSPRFDQIWPFISDFFTHQEVVAHNIRFDDRYLRKTLEFYGIEQPTYTKHCTLKLYGRGLATLAVEHGITLRHHNALSDARACAILFQKYLHKKSKSLSE